MNLPMRSYFGNIASNLLQKNMTMQYNNSLSHLIIRAPLYSLSFKLKRVEFSPNPKP